MATIERSSTEQTEWLRRHGHQSRRRVRPTKLLGPAKWTYYYLYVIIDIYGRYVPGWMLAHAENAKLAEALLADTVAKQNIGHGQLTIHADRGSPMVAKPVAFLLADLGVTKSHSRPHQSNDNPYSESQFRTLKYRPDFPERFGCFEDAQAHCREFFGWSQRRAPSLRHRVPHPRRCPLRASGRHPPAARRRPRRGLHRPPRTVRAQAARTAEAAHRRLDQQARGGQHDDTVIPATTCLKKVDTRRITFIDAGIVPSIGTVGDALDNALMESTIGLYKTELIDHPDRTRAWAGRAEIEAHTAAWVHWYNTTRIHHSIGKTAPIEFEPAWQLAHPHQDIA